MLDKTWEFLGQQGDQTNPKGNQPWIFFGRTDAEAPILWPPDTKSWLLWKDHDAGKDWGGRRRGCQRMRWLDGITESMGWVWASSGSWWWTEKRGVLQSMGSKRVRHNWATELNWTVPIKISILYSLEAFLLAKGDAAWFIKCWIKLTRSSNLLSWIF